MYLTFYFRGDKEILHIITVHPIYNKNDTNIFSYILIYFHTYYMWKYISVIFVLY